MGKILVVVLCLGMMTGCAYYAKTTITAKGKDVKAIAGGVPIKGDADVIVERVCKFIMWSEDITPEVVK